MIRLLVFVCIFVSDLLSTCLFVAFCLRYAHDTPVYLRYAHDTPVCLRLSFCLRSAHHMSICLFFLSFSSQIGFALRIYSIACERRRIMALKDKEYHQTNYDDMPGPRLMTSKVLFTKSL